MRKQYRQGDVLLNEVDAIPAGVTKAKGEIVLAGGEHTGNKHRFSENPNVCGFLKEGAEDHTIAGGTYVGEPTNVAAIEVLRQAVVLEHVGPERQNDTKHSAIPVEPAKYEVRRQREYVADGVERQVVD